MLEALRRGRERRRRSTRARAIDPWFLRELAELAADPRRRSRGERTFKAVDTCAAEFEAETPVLLLGLGARRADHEVAPRRRARA